MKRAHPIRLAGRLLALALALPGVRAAAEAEAPRTFDWGFIATRRVDLDGNLRLTMLGPFFEFTTQADGDGFQAVRPIYSHIEDGEQDRERYEIVWPLCTAKRFEEAVTARFLTAIYMDWDRDDPDSRWRLWVLPFYFQGRDAQGEPYVALWPIGGSIHEFMQEDEIDFVLWPLWMSTARNDLRGRHVLWPLIGRTTGDGVDRFRVLPFYAHSTREGQWTRKAYFWPLYTSASFDMAYVKGGGYMIFPLWGHIETNVAETWYVIPPLNRFSRSASQNSTHIVWPFFQYYTGEIEKLYFWPVWGRKIQAGSASSFFLWPIFRTQAIDQLETVKNYNLALPFYHSRVDVEASPAPGEEPAVKSGRKTIWPLFSYRWDGDRSTFHLLHLWPFKHDGPIERNLAPFWTLYTRERAGDVRESELLWGLYRHHARGTQERYVSVFPFFTYHRRDDPEFRSFSLLKGLLGYEAGREGRNWRVLYVLRLGPDVEDPQ